LISALFGPQLGSLQLSQSFSGPFPELQMNHIPCSRTVWHSFWNISPAPRCPLKFHWRPRDSTQTCPCRTPRECWECSGASFGKRVKVSWRYLLS
jgi:hypothetical protein